MDKLELLWKNIKLNKCKIANVDEFIALYINRSNTDCFLIEGFGMEIINSIKANESLGHFFNNVFELYNDINKDDLINDTFEFINALIENNILKFNITSSPFVIERHNSSCEESEYIQNSHIVQNYYLQNKLPYKVFLEITYKCNLDCEHCYLGDEKFIDKGTVPIDRLKSLVDEFEELGVVELVITGGEIGLYSHLIELLNYTKDKNILVTLLTNGTCFTESQIRNILDSGIHDIRVSVYGFEDFHDKFVNLKGSFKKSIELLKYTRANANIGSASCVITKENINDIKKLKNYLEQFNIPINITPVIFPTIYGDKKPLELRLNRYELKEIVNELNLRVGGSICTAGISRFRITPYGDVNPCEMLRHISLGNIKDSSFKEIISSSNALKWHDQFNDVMNNKCVGCEKKDQCINCMGLSYLETGVLDNKTSFACELADLY